MTLRTEAEWEAIEPKLAAHKYIVLHHTAGPVDQTINDIDAEHRAQGWAGVGYHRIVQQDGTIHTGRPDDVMGAQAQDLNRVSIGVAVIGNWMNDIPRLPQWKGMVHCLAVECARWDIPVENIIGHRDVARIVGDPLVATACPGDALYALMGKIRNEASSRWRGWSSDDSRS